MRVETNKSAPRNLEEIIKESALKVRVQELLKGIYANYDSNVVFPNSIVREMAKEVVEANAIQIK